jgi:hypothetical protein
LAVGLDGHWAGLEDECSQFLLAAASHTVDLDLIVACRHIMTPSSLSGAIIKRAKVSTLVYGYGIRANVQKVCIDLSGGGRNLADVLGHGLMCPRLANFHAHVHVPIAIVDACVRVRVLSFVLLATRHPSSFFPSVWTAV